MSATSVFDMGKNTTAWTNMTFVYDQTTIDRIRKLIDEAAERMAKERQELEESLSRMMCLRCGCVPRLVDHACYGPAIALCEHMIEEFRKICPPGKGETNPLYRLPILEVKHLLPQEIVA